MRRRPPTWARHRLAGIAAAPALVALAGACAAPVVSPPAPTVSAPVVSPPVSSPTAGTDRPATAMRWEQAALAPDGSRVTLTFVGGAPYLAGDWCTNAYAGWAALAADGVLEAAVEDVTPPADISPPTQAACDAVGHERSVDVALSMPYAGWKVRDIADGRIHIGRTPPSLARLEPGPGWQPYREQELLIDLGTIPVWERWWTRVAEPQGPSSPGSLILSQGFGGATGITGGPERHDVTVGTKPGVLFRTPETGELLVVWLLDDDGFALDANEADVSPDELVRLAGTVVHP